MKEHNYEVQSLTILLLRILWQPMSPGLVGMLFNLNGLGGVALKILLVDGHFEISTVLYFSKIV